MRARLHVRGGRIGFFREGTHSLCDARLTRQLRDDSMDVIGALERSLSVLDRPTVAEIEMSENVEASERALHLELLPDVDPSRLATLTAIDGLTGVTCAPVDHPRTMELWGSPFVTDRVRDAVLTRHARSFFQGNRFLLPALVDHVLHLISGEPLLDLYAGVGLFSVVAAAAGQGPVTAVEGDRFSAADLKRNATGQDITVIVGPVEKFLERPQGVWSTAVVDPPRTGMSKEATAGVIALGVPRLIYVSCDIATLARDASPVTRRRLSDRQHARVRSVPEHRARRDGYRLRSLAACTSPSNSSRNSPVRQKFSGCHCTATQNGPSSFSIASMTPSGEVAVTSKPWATSLTDW